MARAGISGIGIKSALGGNRTETLKNLFADFPALPGGTDRYQTELDLPVFTLPEKKDPEFFFEWPVYLLQHALEEALSHANLTLDDLKKMIRPSVEEMVTEQLYHIFPVGVPVVMMVLSILFCALQAMVFTMLTSIYLDEVTEIE